MKIKDITDTEEKKKPKVSVDKMNSILLAALHESDALFAKGFLTKTDLGHFQLSIYRMKDTINKKK